MEVVKKELPKGQAVGGHRERAWGFPLNQPSGKLAARARFYYETNKAGVPTNMVLAWKGQRVQLAVAPRAENAAWVNLLLDQMAMPQRERVGDEGSRHDASAITMHASEASMRASMARVVDIVDGSKGNGYVLLVRDELSGQVRLLVRAAMSGGKSR